MFVSVLGVTTPLPFVRTLHDLEYKLFSSINGKTHGKYVHGAIETMYWVYRVTVEMGKYDIEALLQTENTPMAGKSPKLAQKLRAAHI